MGELGNTHMSELVFPYIFIHVSGYKTHGNHERGKLQPTRISTVCYHVKVVTSERRDATGVKIDSSPLAVASTTHILLELRSYSR